jgi:DNA-binding NarL/FixJ family response regulator
MINKGRS